MKTNDNRIHIFWTGGWDSTFRLIQLLTTTTSYVQPHYIVRHEKSTGIEIQTMIDLRRSIIKEYPEVRSIFLPTKYTNEDHIFKHIDIIEQIDCLKKTIKVNEQYSLMANYCKTNSIDQIEVALTSLSSEKTAFNCFKNSPAFKYFTYPIIGLNKKDMLKIAELNNWTSILLTTSFCRRPSIITKACGKCGPCVDVAASGMSFRLSPSSRIKATIQIPLRKYWRNSYSKHNTHKVYLQIKQWFLHRA